MNRSDCPRSLVFGFFGFGFVPAFAMRLVYLHDRNGILQGP
jgi:hypothetical protein